MWPLTCQCCIGPKETEKRQRQRAALTKFRCIQCERIEIQNQMYQMRRGRDLLFADKQQVIKTDKYDCETKLHRYAARTNFSKMNHLTNASQTSLLD